MAPEEVKLQVDDDPEFDDSDLYDNDNGAGTETDTQTIIKVAPPSDHVKDNTPAAETTHPTDQIAQAQIEGIKTGKTQIEPKQVEQPEIAQEKIEQNQHSHPNVTDGSNTKSNEGGETEAKTEDISMVDANAVEQSSSSAIDATSGEAQPSVTAINSGNALTFNREFIEAARANRGDHEAEFEEDSNPALSDDSSDSSDSDSDDTSSDDDSDYGSVILDPAEAARILMRASTPEESGAGGGPPRTLNEQQEKPLDIPIIPQINDTNIIELGQISHIIKETNCVVIKATVHINHNVLQPGTALCLADRTLLRPISDTIAQVQEPYYVSYFESTDEMASFGIQEGVKVFYPDHPDYRSFVFYEELRKQKFTDASNINDEEIDDREIEFSDDEQEAAYKKAKKEEKHRKYGDRQDDGESVVSEQNHQGRGRGRGRGGGGNRGRGQRGRGRGGRGGWQDYDGGHATEASYAPTPVPPPTGGLDYGDDASDGYYKKLQRPDDYGTWQNTPPRPDLQPQHSGGELGNFRGRNRWRDYQAQQRGNRGRGSHYHHSAPVDQMQASTQMQAPAPFQMFPPNIASNPPMPPNLYGQNNGMFSQGAGGQYGMYQNQYGAQNGQGSGNMDWQANANANANQQNPMNMPPPFGNGNFPFRYGGGPFNGFQGGNGNGS